MQPGPHEPAESPDAELDERRFQVITEQAEKLRWQIVLTAGIISVIVHGSVPPAWILLWFVAVLVVREWRAAALRRMLGQGVAQAYRLRRTVGWNLLLGATNGAAALFMFSLDDTLRALLTMVLVSWGAGAVSTSSTVMKAFHAYAACMFLPTAAIWFWLGGPLGLGTGALVLMFYGVQIRFARHNCATFEESFRIRLDNLQLARSLAVARDEAQRANEAKSRFLARASHDLRQPLQALAFNTSDLVHVADGTDMQPLALEIFTSIKNLRSMLTGLLEISNLDAGGEDARPRDFDLAEMLHGIAASFRAAATAKGLGLDVQCERRLVVHTDPRLMLSAVSNLVDNAIKYTASGGVLLCVQHADGGTVVRVSDTGPGIAETDQERIFVELVQLQNPERDRAKGYGLGLSIVRRLVRLMGARLELQSTPGLGSTFLLHLPPSAQGHGAESGPPTSLAQDASVPPLAGRQVLVLDDNAAVRAAYERVLVRAGAHCRTVGSTAQALTALDSTVYDVAFVDYRLADGEDGLSAIAALRRIHPQLPALLCSADTTPELTARAARFGVAALQKPIDDTTLIQAAASAAQSTQEQA